MKYRPNPISKQFRLISHGMQEICNRQLLDYNLTGQQLDILVFLKLQADEEIHQREIEQWFHLTNPTVTGLLNRLESKHFIVRKTNPDDRRFRVIELTEEGNDLVDQVTETLQVLDQRTFEGVSEEEQEQLGNILGKILENMKNISGICRQK